MVRRILIPLDPSPYSKAAIEFGCYIAKRNSAEITGMTVLDVPGMIKSIGSSPTAGLNYTAELMRTYKKDATRHIEALVQAFVGRCKKDGIAYRLSAFQGSPSKRISEVSIYFDLVIAGLRTYYGFSSGEDKGKSLIDILDNSISSVIATPSEYKAPAEGTKVKVLVAFDGSKPAGRALHRFSGLFDASRYEVTILMSHADQEVARYHLDRAARYLSAHSFTDIDTKWTPTNIIKAVDNSLDQVHAVVLGVHSKKGFIDFRLGSLSSHLIQRGDKLLYLVQ